MAITKIMSFDTSKPCEIPFFECDLREDIEFDLKDIENMVDEKPAKLRKVLAGGLVLKFPTIAMTTAEATKLLEQIRRGTERLQNTVNELECETEALEQIAKFHDLLARC